MKYDKELQISIGSGRWSTSWPVSLMKWSEFCVKLRTPVKGPETLGEFLKLQKAEQDNRKDVGGFVGGVIEGERRKVSNVKSRDLITLDLDNIPANKTEEVLGRVQMLSCAAAVYSTRKHRRAAPRLRIIIPTDRTMEVDEYEPAARRVAKLIGIDYCDPTTFELNRLMFWPSVSSDSEYVCETYDAPFLAVDSILRMYGDWRDAAQWPTAEGERAVEKRRLAKQADPTTKAGIVGAFCRTYTVTAAMEKFLPGVYEPAKNDGRYTYVGGSTTGGAIVYDEDRWMYSHHATDPCSGQLVNAFDMVRLHKFGSMDEETKPGMPVNRTPSFLAMRDFALEDKTVGKLMAAERQEEAKKTFAGVEIRAPDESADWREKLAVDKSGSYRKTINNLVVILQNDPALKGKIVTDEFADCGRVVGQLPWNSMDGRRRWSDADDAGALWYMETFYGIPNKDKLISALMIVGGQNVVNEVKEFLLGLKWDGRRRLDRLFIDYLGADTNVYTKAVARKSLTAAVARAIEGGTKYDYMPILAGPQGIGKSTLLATLGKGWFSDSLTAFEGKEAAEMLRGTWINEVGELNAMSKYETAAVKQFLSKRTDIYRAAYGRRTEEHPRRCVFFGTTNDVEFLKDGTGNRRFWPVDVGINDPVKSVFDDLPGEVDQIWAEAVLYWRAGEPLYLDGEAERLAEQAQEEHQETSGWEGMIRGFLEIEVPLNWDQMDKAARKIFLQGNSQIAGEDLRPIDKVCVMEIWEECIGGDQKYLKPADRKKIGEILAHTRGWSRIKTNARFGPYGVQKGFFRVDNTVDSSVDTVDTSTINRVNRVNRKKPYG